jgi:hypothetical protein
MILSIVKKEESFICQICKKDICSGDRVIRCLEGEIIERKTEIEFNVDEITYNHFDCFNVWVQALQEPIELKDFERLGAFKNEDGSMRIYYAKPEKTSQKLEKIKNIIFADTPNKDYPNIYYKIKEILEGKS